MQWSQQLFSFFRVQTQQHNAPWRVEHLFSIPCAISGEPPPFLPPAVLCCVCWITTSYRPKTEPLWLQPGVLCCVVCGVQAADKQRAVLKVKQAEADDALVRIQASMMQVSALGFWFVSCEVILAALIDVIVPRLTGSAGASTGWSSTWGHLLLAACTLATVKQTCIVTCCGVH